MSSKSRLLQAMRNLTIAFRGMQAGITSINVQSQTTGTLFNDVVREVARTDKENALLKKELKEIRKELDALQPKKKKTPKKNGKIVPKKVET